MKGSGAASVATLGAAGVEVAQDVLAETESPVQPLVTTYARLDEWRRGQAPGTKNDRLKANCAREAMVSMFRDG